MRVFYFALLGSIILTSCLNNKIINKLSMSDFNIVWEQWKEAAISGSLLTDRHDPNSTTPESFNYKTVLSIELSGSLERTIVNKEFEKVEYYVNSQNPKKDFYIVTPKDFDVIGFARYTGSFNNAEPQDKIRIYYGNSQGWHSCVETSSFFEHSKATGSFQLVEKWDSF